MKSTWQKIMELIPDQGRVDLDKWFEEQYPTRDMTKPLVQENSEDGYRMTMYTALDGRKVFYRDPDCKDEDFRNFIKKQRESK